MICDPEQDAFVWAFFNQRLLHLSPSDFKDRDWLVEFKHMLGPALSPDLQWQDLSPSRFSSMKAESVVHAQYHILDVSKKHRWGRLRSYLMHRA